MYVPLAIFFLPPCSAAAVWPNGLGNFHKNFLANLVTELLTHSVPFLAGFTFLLNKLPLKPDDMYDAADEAELQKWKDSKHPWTSPGTAPVFGDGCAANGGNPYGCNCQENGFNDCYGDDDRAYGSCCGKVRLGIKITSGCKYAINSRVKENVEDS